jgi:hypothetical protein
MGWIVLVVLLGVAAGLLIIAFGWQRTALAVLALMAAGVAILAWQTRESTPSRSRTFDPAALAIEGFTMRPSYGGAYTATARVTNGAAERTVLDFTLSVTARDCPAPDSDTALCAVVGEATRDIYAEVPGGQSRDITEQYVFERMSPKGTLRFEPHVARVRAR